MSGDVNEKLDDLDTRVKKLEDRDPLIDKVVEKQIVMGVEVKNLKEKIDSVLVTTSSIAQDIQQMKIDRVEDMSKFKEGKAQEIGNTRWAAVIIIFSFLGIMLTAVLWTNSNVTDNVNRMSKIVKEETIKNKRYLDTLFIRLNTINIKQKIYHPEGNKE